MTFFIQSLNRKIISMVIFLMGMAIFSGAFPSKGFPWPLPPFQLFFSHCPLFRECDQDTSPEQVNHWGVSSHAGLTPEDGTSATSVFSHHKEGMQRELRVAQRMEREVWSSFKAVFSSLPPLLIDSWSWRNSCGPNWTARCCCQKSLLPPCPPLFSLPPLQVTGTFLPLLRFSLPIPITSFNLLCPPLLFILFFFIPRRQKEGALASQLFTCKYFLYFCPDLAKFGVLQEQATESLLFPSGILAAKEFTRPMENWHSFIPAAKLVS